MTVDKSSDRIRRMSLIDDSGPGFVRMANLACVGSHAINGVAELHSRLLRETVLRDFYEMWPEKFQNKTNGVTPRRFMMIGNPDLTALLTKTLGKGWVRDLRKLRELEAHADDPAFQEDWRRVKLARKEALATVVRRDCGIELDPASLDHHERLTIPGGRHTISIAFSLQLNDVRSVGCCLHFLG